MAMMRRRRLRMIAKTKQRQKGKRKNMMRQNHFLMDCKLRQKNPSQDRICRRKKKLTHRHLVRLQGSINRVTCNKREGIDGIIIIEIIEIIITATGSNNNSSHSNNNNRSKVMDMEAGIDGSANDKKQKKDL